MLPALRCVSLWRRCVSATVRARRACQMRDFKKTLAARIGNVKQHEKSEEARHSKSMVRRASPRCCRTCTHARSHTQLSHRYRLCRTCSCRIS